MQSNRNRLLFAAAVFAIILTLGGDGGSDRAYAGNGKGKKAKVGKRCEVVVFVEDSTGLDDLEATAGSKGRKSGKTPGLHLLSLPATASPKAVAAHLRKLTGVKRAEPDFEVRHCEGYQSTIPALGDEPWEKSAFEGQAAFQAIRRSAAADHATGAGVAVAVIDTGIRASHECLSGHLSSTQFDFLDWDGLPDETEGSVDEDGDGIADEARGHGTFVSGLVAALAPDAAVMPLRILSDDGVGTTFAMADAIYYAVANGARVINLSLGTAEPSAVVEDAIRFALDRDTVVIAAAGNTGDETIAFPASIPGVISVTSVDEGGVKASFANYHPDVSISAPGVSILGPWSGSNDQSYASWAGTSFSAPMVAAGAALVLEKHPDYTSSEVRTALLGAVQDVDALNGEFSGKIGRGRLDLAAIFGE